MFSRRVLRIKAMQHLYAFSLQRKLGIATAKHMSTTIPSQKQETSLDLQEVQNGLSQHIQKIKAAVLYFLQLLVAWAAIDQERADTLLQPPHTTLAKNIFLKQLQENSLFSHLCELYTVNCSKHVAENWYYQYVKPHPSYIAYIGQSPSTSEHDIGIINTLVSKIIFKLN